MREIHTIDPAIWSEPNEKGLVRQIGMKTAQEVFDQLKTHLESLDMIPDEYFHLSSLIDGRSTLPSYRDAICHTNWGGNEGIYIDILLRYTDENQKLCTMNFAVGKSLYASGDNFLHMSRIAAECSMMLNSWGDIVKIHGPEEKMEKETDFTKAEMQEMLDSLVHSKNLSDRVAVAKLGYGLDKLVHDEEFQVRRACAEKGFGEHVLAKDPETAVRETLARNGHCLEELQRDPAASVRAEVALRGHGLDDLIKDTSVIVRASVARYGREQDLAVLVKDPEWFVREEVAKLGYGLDKLTHDKDRTVATAAAWYLKTNGMTLSEWMEQNPSKCALPQEKKRGLDSVIAAANQKKEANKAESVASDRKIEKPLDAYEGR